MASGNHVCKPICADLPVAPTNNKIQMIVNFSTSKPKKEKVEPMTLKAFVREQVEKGKELPFDLFGVYIANKAKLTTKE